MLLLGLTGLSVNAIAEHASSEGFGSFDNGGTYRPVDSTGFNPVQEAYNKNIVSKFRDTFYNLQKDLQTLVSASVVNPDTDIEARLRRITSKLFEGGKSKVEPGKVLELFARPILEVVLDTNPSLNQVLGAKARSALNQYGNVKEGSIAANILAEGQRLEPSSTINSEPSRDKPLTIRAAIGFGTTP